MSRLRILQVITGLSPGGAERLVLDMIRRFDSNRFDVRLASLTDDLNGLDVFGYPDQAVEVFDLRKGPRVANLLKMKRFIELFAPDVIHAHLFHGLVATVTSTRFSACSPAICFTSHLDRYPLPHRLTVRFLKSWRSADVIFEPDQHPEMNVARTLVFPNGVSVPLLPPSRNRWSGEGTLRLLAVGRLVQQKDPLGLIRSLANADLPEWSLDWIGIGPLEAAIRKLSAELGVENRVNLLGIRSDIRQQMRDADIFVMHSAFEGMPMSLLEAGAEAMPVVSTPVGSIPGILANDRGVLALPDQFGQALCRLAQSPALALAMGLKLWSHVSIKHSIESTTIAHEHLYQELAGGKKIQSGREVL